jgi:hypothetical protein
MPRSKLLTRRATSLPNQIDEILAQMMKDVDEAFETCAVETTGNPWGNCTTAAENVIKQIGHGDIYGYQKEHNPTAELADGDGEGGHDFAIIDNFIVDPWAADYMGTPGRIALSDTALITKLYGDPQCWEKREGSGTHYTRLPLGQGLPPALQNLAKTATPMHSGDAAKLYYHGNSNEKASQSILQGGIQPREVAMPDRAKDRAQLAPAKGRVYVTPDFTFAAIHALGSNTFGSGYYSKYNIGPAKDQNPYGYIFEMRGEDLTGDVVPDEDSIGGFLTALLEMDKAEKRHTEITKQKSPLKWPGEAESLSRTIQYAIQSPINSTNTPESVRNELRFAASRVMTERQREKVMDGDIGGQAPVGKKIQKLLSPQTIKWMLDNGAHLAHLGAIYPIKAWRFKKANADKVQREDVLSICEEIPVHQQQKAASVKTGSWMRAEELKAGDLLAFPAPVVRIRSVHRENDEIIVIGGPGVVRRFDPQDEVNTLRKTAAASAV